MGQLTIARIPADKAPSIFPERFYATEQPVIIEEVCAPDSLKARLGSQKILEEIVEGEEERDLNPHDIGWLDMTAEVLSKQHADTAFRDFIASLIPRTGVSFRRTWVRLFGHKEGDLLFVPRGWSHFVVALDSWNANATWVFTPRDEPTSTPVGRREMASALAMDWLRRPGVHRWLPRWMKAHVDVETRDEEFESRVASFRRKAALAPVAADIAREASLIPLAIAAHLLYQVLPDAPPRKR